MIKVRIERVANANIVTLSQIPIGTLFTCDTIGCITAASDNVYVCREERVDERAPYGRSILLIQEALSDSTVGGAAMFNHVVYGYRVVDLEIIARQRA